MIDTNGLIDLLQSTAIVVLGITVVMVGRRR